MIANKYSRWQRPLFIVGLLWLAFVKMVAYLRPPTTYVWFNGRPEMYQPIFTFLYLVGVLFLIPFLYEWLDLREKAKVFDQRLRITETAKSLIRALVGSSNGPGQAHAYPGGKQVQPNDRRKKALRIGISFCIGILLLIFILEGGLGARAATLVGVFIYFFVYLFEIIFGILWMLMQAFPLVLLFGTAVNLIAFFRILKKSDRKPLKRNLYLLIATNVVVVLSLLLTLDHYLKK